MKQFDYIIRDELGIHTRPAELLVKCIQNCKSTVTLAKDSRIVDATNLLAVMSMGIKCGHTVTVTVTGQNEDHDFEVIKNFFVKNL